MIYKLGSPISTRFFNVNKFINHLDSDLFLIKPDMWKNNNHFLKITTSSWTFPC